MKTIEIRFATKVFIFFSVFMTLVSIVFISSFIVYQSDYITSRLEQKGRLLADVLANTCRIGVFSENEQLLRTSIGGILDPKDLDVVEIFDDNGNLLQRWTRDGAFDSSPDSGAPSMPSQWATADDSMFWKESGQLEFQRKVFSAGSLDSEEALFFGGAEMDSRDRVIGFIHLTLDASSARIRIDSLLYRTLGIGLFFWALGGVIVYFLAKTVSTPIEKLYEGVLSLESGGSFVPPEIDARDEIGRLGIAFNQMADTLRLREECLKEANYTLETVIDSSPLAIVTVNPAGTVSIWNRAAEQLFGWRADEVIDKPCPMESFGEYSGGDSKTCGLSRRIQDGSKPVRGEEFQCPRKDGNLVDVALWTAPLWDDRESVSRNLCLFEDITERIKARERERIHREQLIHADKMVSLGTLVAGAAHEINNPNNFILLNATTLSRVWKEILPILDAHRRQNGEFQVLGYDGSEISEKFLDTCADIQEGSRRIKEVVRDLKEFSKKDDPNSMRPVDINDAVRSAVRMMKHEIRKSTDRFEESYDHMPPIAAHPRQIEQVVVNLIQNSIHALPKKDKYIIVRTVNHADEGFVAIEVEDEGMGISPEDMKRIFDPFFTTRRTAGGTGLGLSISDAIIQRHRGRLVYDSAPGAGTTARVILPYAEAQPEPDEGSRKAN